MTTINSLAEKPIEKFPIRQELKNREKRTACAEACRRKALQLIWSGRTKGTRRSGEGRQFKLGLVGSVREHRISQSLSQGLLEQETMEYLLIRHFKVGAPPLETYFGKITPVGRHIQRITVEAKRFIVVWLLLAQVRIKMKRYRQKKSLGGKDQTESTS